MYASDGYQWRQEARVPPSPSQGRATVRLPPSKFFLFFRANFFYFFLPYPIKAPIYPFSFPLRGFLFLCVYFPIRVSFRVSEGKNGENKNCFSCPTYVCLVIIRSILIFCYFPLLCFSVLFPPLCLPIVLLSVLCSCIVFCCGCCVFR